MRTDKDKNMNKIIDSKGLEVNRDKGSEPKTLNSKETEIKSCTIPDDPRTDFEKGYTKGWCEGFNSGKQNKGNEQLRAFKEFLQSEYHLPISYKMIDEFKTKT